MNLERVISGILLLVMGSVLLLVGLKAVTSGSVAPFRMGRWERPEPVDREDQPLAYWGWVVAYLVLGALSLAAALVAGAGHLKLR